MRIVAIYVFNHFGADKLPVILASVQDLSSFSFFAKSTVGETIRFGARTICQRTPEGSRQTIVMPENENYKAHSYVSGYGIAGVVVADAEYDTRTAFSVLLRAISKYEKGGDEKTERKSDVKWVNIDKDQPDSPAWLQDMLKNYQDPKKVDKIEKIQKQLDEVKDLMQKNFDEILKRGETLDSLMAKSEDLSKQSQKFAKEAKKTRCCRSL